MILKVNNCSIDTGAYELRRSEELVPVEPQVFDLRVYLLKNRDRVVSKDELIAHIWNGRVVSDAALSSRIKAVRQAIGDDGASQTCIRTVHRRGFRVVAEVTEGGGAAGSESASSGAANPIEIPAKPTAERETMRGRFGPGAPFRAAALVGIAAVVFFGLAAGWHSLPLGRP